MSVCQDIHAKAIQQLWDRGIQNASEIRKRTSLPRSTIYYNISKLKESGSVTHRNHSGRPRKISSESSRMLVQQVKKNPAISSRALSTRLLKKKFKFLM